MRKAIVTFDDRGFEELGIDDLVGHCREAGIENFEEIACHGDGAVVQVDLSAPLATDEVESLNYVDRLEVIPTGEDTHRYLIGFTAPEVTGVHAEELVGDCDAELTDYGATVSLVGPQTAIRETLEVYESAGVTPEIRKLGEYAGTESPLDDLTDRQEEVIETAYELGYYEVPRTASTEDLAAELGVDPSTVAEHLQRAERNLLTRYFSTTV